MLKPHHKQADLLMQVACRSGRHSVNRRRMPPLDTFSQLIKRGSLTVVREGPPRTRTTIVALTEAGRKESLELAPHYGVKPEALVAPHLEQA